MIGFLLLLLTGLLFSGTFAWMDWSHMRNDFNKEQQPALLFLERAVKFHAVAIPVVIVLLVVLL